MDNMRMAQVEVEEVYDDSRCEEPLDCLGCGLCGINSEEE